MRTSITKLSTLSDKPERLLWSTMDQGGVFSYDGLLPPKEGLYCVLEYIDAHRAIKTAFLTLAALLNPHGPRLGNPIDPISWVAMQRCQFHKQIGTAKGERDAE